MDPNEALKDVGLEEKEARIYLALLELGEATVLLISKKSGIKRPTAYLVLESLEMKGFINRSAHGKKLLFIPQHPQKLLTEAELQLKEMQEVVPTLESLFLKSSGRPRVMIYQGKEALDRVYDELFVVRGEVFFIDTHSLSLDVFPRTFKKLDYVTLSSEFKIRELIAESEDGRRFAQKVRGPFYGVRFLPPALSPFETDIGIFGTRVLITSVKKEFFTVGIESEEIANAFRKIFEVLWNTANE